MGVHIAGSILLFAFGVLLVVVGAVFMKQDPNDPDKKSKGVAQGVVLVLGGVVILSGSAWFWWALDTILSAD